MARQFQCQQGTTLRPLTFISGLLPPVQFLGSLRIAFQNRLQILACVRLRHLDQILRRSRSDNGTAAAAALRTQVDQIVRGLNDIEIMLDDEDGLPDSTSR